MKNIQLFMIIFLFGISNLFAGTRHHYNNLVLIGSPHWNVKAFGVQGDGATDDLAKVQIALDTLEANGGGILYFPEGTYRFIKPSSATTTTLFQITSDNISIVGDGKNKTILQFDSVGANFLQFQGANYCSVSELTIQNYMTGAARSEAVNRGVYIDSCSYITVSGVVFNQTQLVMIDSSNHCSIDDVDFVWSLRSFGINSCNYNKISNLSFYECGKVSSLGNRRYSFTIDGGSYNVINNVTLEDCGCIGKFIGGESAFLGNVLSNFTINVKDTAATGGTGYIFRTDLADSDVEPGTVYSWVDNSFSNFQINIDSVHASTNLSTTIAIAGTDGVPLKGNFSNFNITSPIQAVEIANVRDFNLNNFNVKVTGSGNVIETSSLDGVAFSNFIINAVDGDGFVLGENNDMDQNVTLSNVHVSLSQSDVSGGNCFELRDVSGLKMVNCEARGGRYGILDADDVDQISVLNSLFFDNFSAGVLLSSGTDSSQIIGCEFNAIDNNALQISSGHCIISVNWFHDDSSGTTDFIQLDGDSCLVSNNIFGTATNIIDDNGTGNRFSENIGFVTYNSGESTNIIPGGGISHGLDVTPGFANIVPAGSVLSSFRVSEIDSDSLYVTFAGADSCNFYWETRK